MAKLILNPLNFLLIMLMSPPDITIHIGPLNFPIYRMYLLIVTPICMIKYFSIRKNLVDLFIISYIFWGFVSLAYNHGTSEWQYAGILFVETATPYLLARIYISGQQEFEKFVKLYYSLVLVILPFAVYETLTGDHLIRDLSRQLMGYGPLGGRPARLDLERAYGPFEHPIHYGVFCSAIFGLILATKGSATKKVFQWSTISIAVFASLSSGPLFSLVLQNVFKIWDLGTKWLAFRWRILALIFAALYVLIDLLSNRTPFHVLVSYGTFRLASAYNRIHIWNYGSASVAEHPMFGIGLNDWERAPWMSSSMDNFWLLTTVRYGLPAFVFLSLALAWLFLQLSRKTVSDQVGEYRKGWCISLVALIVAGCTVHFWTALYCLFFMMVGSSAWILYAPEKAKQTVGADEDPEGSPSNGAPPESRKPVFTRFPKLQNKSGGRPAAAFSYSRNHASKTNMRPKT